MIATSLLEWCAKFWQIGALTPLFAYCYLVSLISGYDLFYSPLLSLPKGGAQSVIHHTKGGLPDKRFDLSEIIAFVQQRPDLSKLILGKIQARGGLAMLLRGEPSLPYKSGAMGASPSALCRREDVLALLLTLVQYEKMYTTREERAAHTITRIGDWVLIQKRDGSAEYFHAESLERAREFV